jgi:uroporphyrinogen III methyltransferase/synthase
MKIESPGDWSPVDRALQRLHEYHWLAFTSSNGVHAFLERLKHGGRDLRALGHLRLAVIGPATAEALRNYHLEPDVVPNEYNSESLAASLLDKVAGQRVLLARADRGIELLREELSAVASVDQVAVYSQVDFLLGPDTEALRMLSRGEVDFVTITSSNIARAICQAVDESGKQHILSNRTAIVSISPRTSAVVRDFGLPVAGEAREYTTEGVVQACCGLARRS